MSRADCHSLDDRLMDYLYEELDSREMDEMRAHVEGCPRCSAEVGRFRGVRRAVAQLEMAEPPAAVSAKLLHQAAHVQRQSLWRRSRAVRVTMYAAPVVAMAAAFVLLIHVKNEPMMARTPVSAVEIEGKLAQAPAAEPTTIPAVPAGVEKPAVEAESKAETRGGFLKDEDKAKATEEKAEKERKITTADDASLSKGGEGGGGRYDRKVQFKPPVTRTTKLGKATHAAADPSGQAGSNISGTGRGPTTAAPQAGEKFDSAIGGLVGGRTSRDVGGAKKKADKAGGDMPAPASEPPMKRPVATPAPKPQAPASKPIEVAKKEAPPLRLQQPAPAPPPPPQANAPRPYQGVPQVSSSPPSAHVTTGNEGYYREKTNLPLDQRPQQVQQAPAANTEMAQPELDETRANTQSLVTRSRREEQQKQAPTSPDQLYSQLITTDDKNCGRVMDLVHQLTTWTGWGDQHPNEMKNAYLLRARCQRDTNLQNKDMENARRWQNENDKRAVSKGKQRSAPKGGNKASDNKATAPAEATQAK